MKILLFFSLILFLPNAYADCLEILSQKIANTAPGIEHLLSKYRGSSSLVDSGKKELFSGIGKKDAYNPTAPFTIDGVEMIAARVESRNSEKDSEVHFFQKLLGEWAPIQNSPILKLQDPFHVKLGTEHVFGGVEIFEKPDSSLGYKTVFYRGTNLNNLKKFSEGPLGMKDIRLSQLPDGKIIVYTRPQGKIPGTDYDAGPGKIGVVTINSLAELTPEKIVHAKILEGLFKDKEWGGVNQVVPLKNGKIGILMHIARFDNKGGRHYYPAAMTFDPKTNTYSEIKILLERENLPNGLQGQSKRADLKDVLFSGGIVLHEDNTATLYVGAGDAEVYSKRINNPFLP